MPKNIPQKLRTIRKELSLTQQEVARKAHISQAALSSIESGESTPTLDTLAAIASALGTSMSDLFGEKYCPVCGFEYTYEAGLKSIAHQSMHRKAEAIVARFGFYWPYRSRKKQAQIAQMILDDPTATPDARYQAALKLLKAYFSRSVAFCEGNHPGFREYVAMLLKNPELGIPKDTRAALVAEYGTMDGIAHGTYYQRPPEQQTQIERISSRLPSLPPKLLTAIDLICDNATPWEGEKQG